MPTTDKKPTSKVIVLMVVEKRYDFPDDTVFLHPNNYKHVEDVSFVFLKSKSGQREFLAVGKSGVLIPVGNVQTVALSEQMRKRLGVRIGDRVRCEGVPAAEKVCVRPLAHTLEGYTGDFRLDTPFERIQKQFFLPRIITKGNPIVVPSGHGKMEFEVVDVDHSSSEHFWWSCAAEVDYQVERVKEVNGKSEGEETGVASVVALWNSTQMGVIVPKTDFQTLNTADRTATATVGETKQEEKHLPNRCVPPLATVRSIKEESKANSEPHDTRFCSGCSHRYQPRNRDCHQLVLLCGHSLCTSCCRNFSACALCATTNATTSSPKKVIQNVYEGNDMFGANRVFQKKKSSECRKKASPIENNEGNMECGGCKLMEKTERMRLCESCLDKHGLNKNMAEQQLTSCLICTTCVVDEHIGHKFIKYVPWKTQEMFRLKSENAVESFKGKKIFYVLEERDGIKHWRKWMQEMKAYADLDTSSFSMSQATKLDKILSVETNKVNESADVTLSPLRKFTACVQFSADRLRRVRADAIAGKL